jgi:hypothetical protein
MMCEFWSALGADSQPHGELEFVDKVLCISHINLVVCDDSEMTGAQNRVLKYNFQ